MKNKGQQLQPAVRSATHEENFVNYVRAVVETNKNRD